MNKKQEKDLEAKIVDLRVGLEAATDRLIKLHGYLNTFNIDGGLKLNSECVIISKNNEVRRDEFIATFRACFGEPDKDNVRLVREKYPALDPHFAHLEHSAQQYKLWIRKVDALKDASELFFNRTFAKIKGIAPEQLERSPVVKKRGAYSRSGMLK